jgi:hypothetical protein
MKNNENYDFVKKSYIIKTKENSLNSKNKENNEICLIIDFSSPAGVQYTSITQAPSLSHGSLTNSQLQLITTSLTTEQNKIAELMRWFDESKSEHYFYLSKFNEIAETLIALSQFKN